ncbi:hypothetical protein Ahy_A02g007105 [Arachis hypogaea]|uniref:PB1-like domain-containing protein n=1 Tax=Arachis hypogaea TaxID=3818 RepID=A0A445EBG5_ARAHY|nr:hypothetical protein Ahy_A02g007105 [Arachis hypogaea]
MAIATSYPLFLPINPKGEVEVKELLCSWLYSNKNHDSSFNILARKKTSSRKLVLAETFLTQELFKSLGYNDYKAMMWFDPNDTNFETGLHPIFGDSEINALREHKIQNKEYEEFYIYFEHHILGGEDAVGCDEAGDPPISYDDGDDAGYENVEDELYKPLPPVSNFPRRQKKKEYKKVRRSSILQQRATQSVENSNSSQHPIEFGDEAHHEHLENTEEAEDDPFVGSFLETIRVHAHECHVCMLYLQ